MKKLPFAVLALLPLLGFSEAHAFRDSAMEKARIAKSTPHMALASDAAAPAKLARREGGHP